MLIKLCKRIRGKRGSPSIEMLLVLPLLIMMLFLIVEMGLVMYDFVTVNYAVTTAASEAAKDGSFNDSIRQNTAEYLKDWTTSGKGLQVDPNAVSPYSSQSSIVVWGPPANQEFQRGETIEVGAVYPVKFQTFLIRGVQDWVTPEPITLKARAVARSEVYFE